MGDVHPLGNPHYWLDPDNGRRIAKGLAAKLGEMDPPDAAYFQQRFQDFDKRLTAAEQKWDAEMKPFHGTQGRDLSPFIPQLCQAFRPECDRVRRAAAGNSAHAEPHHRTDRLDEAGELQGHPGGTVFRFEDPEVSGSTDGRERGAIHAFGRGRKRGYGLLQTFRLRH